MEHGYGVTGQVIADKVGLSQPALFKRFGTKQELFMQALSPPDSSSWFGENESFSVNI
jgi:AcrR family transcriptional regulator